MAKFVSVYQALKACGLEIDSHESDLYVKATAGALSVVQESGWNYSFFNSAIDGSRWIEVPFGFEPFWAARQQAVS